MGQGQKMGMGMEMGRDMNYFQRPAHPPPDMIGTALMMGLPPGGNIPGMKTCISCVYCAYPGLTLSN